MNLPAMFRRRSCPLRTSHRPMRLRYFWPLLGFVVPTLVIGFGFMIPKSCIAGINDLTLGFLSSVVGASVTYWAGVRMVLREPYSKATGVS